MTTREKLAAAISLIHPAQRSDVLDALEAIVQEERQAALADAENSCEGVYSYFGCKGAYAEGASQCVRAIRALKGSK